MDHALHRSTASSSMFDYMNIARQQAYFPSSPAEMRNLGWPRRFDESPDEFDNNGVGDSMRVTRGSGRIIVLGDGTEVLSDSDDAEMFDDEGKDEEELEKKKSPGSKGRNDGGVDDPSKIAEVESNGNPEVVVPGQSSR